MKTSQVSAVDWLLLLVAVTATGLLGLSYFRPNVPEAAEPVDRSALVPAVGQRLSDLSVFAEDGSLGTASLGEDPVLVVAFRSDCNFCEANAENWRSLLDEAAGHARIVAVNVEGRHIAEAWLGRQNLEVDEIWVPAEPQQLGSAWNINGVPTTILLTRDAVVSYAAAGVLTAADATAFRELVKGGPVSVP